MSEVVLILGKSASGKSTSLRNMPEKETYLINVIGKTLPFKGANKKFIEEKGGNKVTTDSYDLINKILSGIDKDRKEIKYIVIDDSQYLLVNEFMKRHSQEGKGNDVFRLYNEIGDHFWHLLWNARFLRKDLTIFFLHHTEETESGSIKAKSIGRMLDEKVDICGMFSICLLCRSIEGKHFFETTKIGDSPAKTPMGMFDTEKIDNDLYLVAQAIETYNKSEGM